MVEYDSIAMKNEIEADAKKAYDSAKQICLMWLAGKDLSPRDINEYYLSKSEYNYARSADHIISNKNEGRLNLKAIIAQDMVKFH
ncbi:MAG: hypothetical protein WCX73_03625 [Candidatus Pacearchaeota archaeon]